jgi:hypothetical protein
MAVLPPFRVAVAPIIAPTPPHRGYATLSGEDTTFIFCQSYGNSLPQSRHTTYVLDDGVPSEQFGFLAVIGKVQRV